MTDPVLFVWPTVLLELAVLGLVAAFWNAFPEAGSGFVHRLQKRFSCFAKRRRLAAAAAGLLAVVGAVATSLRWGVPPPVIHDEFSYVLGAETFAAGELYGAPHPMPDYFETFHVLQRPVHASKYIPGQSLALAAGIVLFGHPIGGVWLLAGLAAAAIVWMLQAWLPSRWALMGGLLAAIHLGFFSLWSYSYFGTLLPALGGVLFLGGVRRVAVNPRLAPSAVTGVGAAVLLGVRPFEGGLLVVFTAAAVALRMPSLRARWRTLVKPAAVAAVPVLAVLCALGWYNGRLLGSPIKLPYVEYERQHPSGPLFLFQTASAMKPESSREFAQFQEEKTEAYADKRTLLGFAVRKVLELSVSWATLAGPALLFVFGVGFFSARRGWHRVAAVVALLMVLAVLTENWSDSRKLAPATGLAFLLAVYGFRALSRSGSPLRRALCRGVIVAVALRMAIGFDGLFAGAKSEPVAQRPAMERALLQSPGQDLVIVRYSPNHDPKDEWVYNEPEIDSAEVVWAHDLGDAMTCRLIGYYPQRKVWLLEPDGTPPKLSPYPAKCGDEER